MSETNDAGGIFRLEHPHQDAVTRRPHQHVWWFFSRRVEQRAQVAHDAHGGSTSARGSLHPLPARSWEQTRVVFATAGCTSAKSMAKALAPASMRTVGKPLPVQFRCNRRPPISTNWPGGEAMSSVCARYGATTHTTSPEAHDRRRAHLAVPADTCRIRTARMITHANHTAHKIL